MDKPGGPLSPDELRATAELARLELSEAELEPLAVELAAMLGYASELAGLDLTGVAPMIHPIPIACPLRADAVGSHTELVAALRNAPAAEPPFFSVPEIFASRESAS